MKPLVILGIVVLSCPMLLAAPVCNTGVCNTPVVAVPAVAIQTVIPLYGVGTANYSASDDETKELLRETNRKLDKLIDLLATPPNGGGDVQPPLRAAKLDTFAIFSAKCVSCHGTTKQAGDFSLVGADGKKRPLSGPEQKSILRHAGSDMPPPGSPQLTAAEKAQIKADFSSGPAIPAAKK